MVRYAAGSRVRGILWIMHVKCGASEGLSKRTERR